MQPITKEHAVKCNDTWVSFDITDAALIDGWVSKIYENNLANQANKLAQDSTAKITDDIVIAELAAIGITTPSLNTIGLFRKQIIADNAAAKLRYENCTHLRNLYVGMAIASSVAPLKYRAVLVPVMLGCAGYMQYTISSGPTKYIPPRRSDL